MRRILAAAAALVLLAQPLQALAVPLDYSGGVCNEYEYQEYVFLSGEPVKFVGTYEVSERTRTDSKTKSEITTISYRFELVPEDKSIEGELDRRITYSITKTSQDGKGQTISKTEPTRYSESIELNGVTYKLADFQFSKSDVIDNRPVSDYYSGSINSRKYYSINNDEGKAIVTISGGDVGYSNFWGNTDTQIISYRIDVDWKSEDENGNQVDRSWQGTVDVQVSDSTTKKLLYSENEASYSSFDGGYVRVTDSEQVSKYTYNLPEMDRDGIPSSYSRKRGTLELSMKKLSKVERLIVPKFRDIGGHWAESDIKKLYSLDVFDETNAFFQPELNMTRLEFTKAVMRACDIRPNAQTTTTRTARTTRNQVRETSIFSDVSATDPDYQYIKSAAEKGIITGTNGLFAPDKPLTRAEAVAILIRALGFESKAPTPGYRTAFHDDRKIPEWAKDSIYVAAEIGIVNGDEYNNFNPDRKLSRAEASALLVNFLEFLEKGLRTDYRENIILFN